MPNSEIIPTINSIANISSDSLDKFMRDGFAYVKIPSASLEDKLLNIKEAALKFFNQPREIKEKNKLNPMTLQGYIDKRNSEKKNQLVEQMTFPPTKPIGLFTEYKTELNEIHETYYFKIVKPLLSAIFHKALQPHGFTTRKIENLFAEITDEIFFLISLLFYPYTPPTTDSRSLEHAVVQHEHVDEGLFTILWVGQEGLQVWLDLSVDNLKTPESTSGAWYDVDPKPGYIIVNIGKALSLMLHQQCNAIRHRVIMPERDRLSFGFFYNPPSTYELRDIIENKLLFSSYSNYIRDYFSSIDKQK